MKAKIKRPIALFGGRKRGVVVTDGAGNQQVVPFTNDSGDALLGDGTIGPPAAASSSVVEVLTVDPAAPSDGTGWFFASGSGPIELSFKYRRGGVTYTVPLATINP